VFRGAATGRGLTREPGRKKASAAAEPPGLSA